METTHKGFKKKKQQLSILVIVRVIVIHQIEKQKEKCFFLCTTIVEIF